MEEAIISVAAALLGMMPKGLVLLTTLSLVVGVIKLAKERTLVQELFCIETLDVYKRQGAHRPEGKPSLLGYHELWTPHR